MSTTPTPGYEFEVSAYDRADDPLPKADARFETRHEAVGVKAVLDRQGYGHVEVEPVSDRRDAHQEDECLLCVPAPHENCEMYTVVLFCDPEEVPLGEAYDDHMVGVPVCNEHFRALTQYRQGRNVSEVNPR